MDARDSITNEDIRDILLSLGYSIKYEVDDDDIEDDENFCAFLERSVPNGNGEHRFIDSIFDVEYGVDFYAILETKIDADGYILHTTDRDNCLNIDDMTCNDLLCQGIGALEEFRWLHTLEHVRMGANNLRFIPEN
jgi:hypothetical protein